MQYAWNYSGTRFLSSENWNYSISYWISYYTCNCFCSLFAGGWGGGVGCRRISSLPSFLFFLLFLNVYEFITNIHCVLQDDDNEGIQVSNEMANRMSLFYAYPTPILKILSDATSKFVTEVWSADYKSLKVHMGNWLFTVQAQIHTCFYLKSVRFFIINIFPKFKSGKMVWTEFVQTIWCFFFLFRSFSSNFQALEIIILIICRVARLHPMRMELANILSQWFTNPGTGKGTLRS